ncbi:hypothetical protein AABB24_003462 [Solanum stoloniferum]|uniref:Uncharacterized protein n=1 Tax=Solanum stoloniferum TaxID=62892 RepID=A0ABD2VBC1_9SOLN
MFGRFGEIFLKFEFWVGLTPIRNLSVSSILRNLNSLLYMLLLTHCWKGEKLVERNLVGNFFGKKQREKLIGKNKGKSWKKCWNQAALTKQETKANSIHIAINF